MKGNTLDDYDLPDGPTFYQVKCDGLVSSNIVSVDPFLPSSGYTAHSNTVKSPLDLRSFHISGPDGQVFNYVYKPVATPDRFHILANDKVVLTGSQVCSSAIEHMSAADYQMHATKHSSKSLLYKGRLIRPGEDLQQLSECFLEGFKSRYNPLTKEVVLWAHFENSTGYSAARLLAAHGPPGETMTVSFAERPLGIDSHDLDFFVDDGHSGYIISAANGNTDINIYSLTSDWTQIHALEATTLQRARREAPSVVRVGGLYYLFTSATAGWYPSESTYIVASSMAGPWSTQTTIGGLTCYGSQSGLIHRVGSSFAMVSNIWGSHWARPARQGSRQLLLPLSLAPDVRKAHLHFYPRVMYKDSNDLKDGQAIYGVQAGRILSQGKPVTGGFGDGRETDGQYDSRVGGWLPGSNGSPPQVAISISDTVSQPVFKITAIEVHFTTVPGSEMYYDTVIDAISKGTKSGPELRLVTSDQSKAEPGFQHYAMTSKLKDVTSVIVQFGMLRASSGIPAQVVEIVIYGY
ncbi:hypothetical protein BCR37DRAFT_376429 [Protomyces lactucae-debilis]|uniref:Glycosyl hydrolase n=1 Tax=Protomyces lactucae-debilis TaxID=2754530 RepID=A0A1Y2FSU7_PROLT|nr:uncharacterized protein BCR37DRAFT_376429 [Protomyces lactucae-debilis]ORY87070.1 hypothetical protein BCR37DRAFT_376429 [Protomyces lactucae-debilis]